MTGFIRKIRKAGFQVRLVDADRIGITPSDQLTKPQRKWLSKNREELLADLRKEAVNEPGRWHEFIDLCVARDVTKADVIALFTEQDISDLCKEPDHQLHLHSQTIAIAIHLQQQTERITSCTPPLKFARYDTSTKPHTCGQCRFFIRIDHPHLGLCQAGEPTGACGNWDLDKRNYCQTFLAVRP